MIATLIATLVEEDYAEDTGELAPDDRLTCHVHGRWIHQCVASPVHVNPVTRHRHRRATGLPSPRDRSLGVATATPNWVSWSTNSPVRSRCAAPAVGAGAAPPPPG